jgi:RNA-splicing ligase RtcB
MPTQLSETLWNWASDIDEATLLQAGKASRLPIVAGHIALMPDAHVGMGATVGSVIPTENAVIPSAVGVDIGCGMIAVQTTLTASRLPDDLDPFVGRLGPVIPAGVGQGHGRSSRSADAWMQANRDRVELTSKQETKAATQFGSLGSATTSSRSASTRTARCGSCCTPAAGASATCGVPKLGAGLRAGRISFERRRATKKLGGRRPDWSRTS